MVGADLGFLWGRRLSEIAMDEQSGAEGLWEVKKMFIGYVCWVAGGWNIIDEVGGVSFRSRTQFDLSRGGIRWGRLWVGWPRRLCSHRLG